MQEDGYLNYAMSPELFQASPELFQACSPLAGVWE